MATETDYRYMLTGSFTDPRRALLFTVEHPRESVLFGSWAFARAYVQRLTDAGVTDVTFTALLPDGTEHRF